MNKKAFTLVELIVVITILAILGTIAFMSFQGYSSMARDSVRISDMANIEKSLELTFLRDGEYPDPTDGVKITYKNSEAWTQGIYGQSTHGKVGRMSKIPLDPLTDIEYTYSVTANNREYQLGGISEGDNVAFNNTVLDTVNAASQTAYALIRGKYNGSVLKVSTGSLTYVLAVPSIINGDMSLTRIEEIIPGNKLIYNGYKNLPSIYSGSILEQVGDIDLSIVNTNDYIVFSGALSELETEVEQIAFVEKLQTAYLNTSIVSESGINEILSVNTVSNTEGTKYIAQTIISGTINSNVKVTAENVSSEGGEVVPNLVCADMTDEDLYNLNSLLDGSREIRIDSNSGDNYVDIYDGEIDSEGFVFENGGLKRSDWCSLDSIELYDIDTIPYEIGYLSNLTWFAADTGNITSFPISFGNLTNLTGIQISDHPNLNTLPSFFINFTHIEEINFNGTDLGDLGTDFAVGYPEGDYCVNDNSICLNSGDNLSFHLNLSCAVNPGYPNANFRKGAIVIEGTAWQNSNSGEACYYECTNGYSGEDCSIAPILCATEPNYENTNFIEGTPIIDGTAWQNTNSGEACYYECINGYSGEQCNELNCSDTYNEACVTQLNNFFEGSGYNGNSSYWLNIDSIQTTANTNGEIPGAIKFLNNIESLMIYSQEMTYLPNELFELNNLWRLSITSNNITSLPSDIGNLTNLRNLTIASPITDVPSAIGNLTNLRNLSLWRIHASTLPASIGNLSNLIYLSLWNSDITSLPDEIGNLTELRNVDFRDVPINSLPLTFWNNNKITNLSLPSELNSLSSNISNLTELTKLDLSDTNVTSLPSEIWNLNKLIELNLLNAGINNIPSDIGNLVNMKSLTLRNNSISDLPIEICNLNGLTELNLMHTNLGSLGKYYSSSTSSETNLGFTIGGNGSNVIITCN